MEFVVDTDSFGCSDSDVYVSIDGRKRTVFSVDAGKNGGGATISMATVGCCGLSIPLKTCYDGQWNNEQGSHHVEVSERLSRNQ